MPLAAWLTLLNPYTAPRVFQQVTGPTYWRTLWILPLPILMALVLISPAHLGRRRLGLGLALALVAAYALWVPSYSGLSLENRVLVRTRPTLKVRWPMYKLAVELDRRVPRRSYVLAPDEVSMWIPTLHEHVYPLKVRHYLNLTRFHLGEEDFARRVALVRYVSGEGEWDAGRFAEGLRRYGVSGVCLRASAYVEEARAALTQAGFARASGDDRHEIWIREVRTIRVVRHPRWAGSIHSDGFESGDLSAWSSTHASPLDRLDP